MLNSDTGYLVLARKYRPQTFADLKGQDALVQTLSNAIASGRIHHAYVLTGIRGCGKTTTARIIAKALNCENGPSTTWNENDPQVQAIAHGNHVDVLEFDAASHTGIEDIKDLFEGVSYAPVQGKYKVYIIDEVHMLSTKAFNALLKTLEEPPEHIKFIFATTEVHKIPVTVLSRCQRFDLRRIPSETLNELYIDILNKEGIKAAPAAIQMIARAADGSARDGLSLLDQAIALAAGDEISEDLVAHMLGHVDSSKLLGLLESLLKGEAPQALEKFADLHALGMDPLLVLKGLLQATHQLTRLKIVPDLDKSETLTEAEKQTLLPMAKELGLESLSRAYQMLLTGYQEAKTSETPHETTEMAFVRVAHLAPLPAIETLLKGRSVSTTEQGQATTSDEVKQPESPKKEEPKQEETKANTATPPWEEEEPTAPAKKPQPEAEASSSPPQKTVVNNWRELVAHIRQQKGALGAMLEQQVAAHDFGEGELTLEVRNSLLSERELVGKLRETLHELTGKSWKINLVYPKKSGKTLADIKEFEAKQRVDIALKDPGVKKLMEAFPGAQVEGVDIIENQQEDE